MAGRAAPVPTVPDGPQDAIAPGADARGAPEDFAGTEQVKDLQSALLNILEDSAADGLAAEDAFRASVNILSDLSEAETEVRTLNAGLEARVALRTAELERVNKNLEAFTYSVAHDLRSPLRALSGFSAALVEDYGDRLDETGRGYAGSIMAASERMAALIDDLLLLSRVSRAGMNLEPVDLSAEAAAIAGELRSGDPGRQIRFTIEDGIRVIADRSLIRTVVQNLLENAWKFTAHREGAVIEFATAATAAEEGMVCCCVRDNGAGFDPAYAASCSSRSSGCTTPPSSRAPVSGWPAWRGSSNGTAGAPGPTAPSARAPASTSPSPRKNRHDVACVRRCRGHVPGARLPGGVVPGAVTPADRRSPAGGRRRASGGCGSRPPPRRPAGRGWPGAAR